MWRTHELLHGDERFVHSDAGYTGIDKREEIRQAQREGRLRKDIEWKTAMKRGLLNAVPDSALKGILELGERMKAQVRALVEHPFHVIKNLFGYRKVSYRGLAKNDARAHMHAALANLVIGERALLAQCAACSSPSR